MPAPDAARPRRAGPAGALRAVRPARTVVAGALRSASRRLRAHGPSLLLAASAAGVAYMLAAGLFGSQNAVFAPIAAVVATGLSAGQRVRRAAEISVGVVLGLVTADLLSRWWGVGPVQIAVTVLVVMAAAVALRSSGLMANQAAVAAMVVMLLVPHLETGPWVRLGDAVIGGAVAVALNAVLGPDPYRIARTTSDRFLQGYAATLRRLAAALREGSLEEAEATLEQMSSLDGARAEIVAAVEATRERLVLRPVDRRERRAYVRSVERVAERIPLMLGTGRGLCRAASNVVRRAGQDEPSRVGEERVALAGAVDLLVDAVDALRDLLTSTGEAEAVRQLALHAASEASGHPPSTPAAAVLVGLARSAAIDLLRATGLAQREAVTVLEDAAGRADDLGA